MNSLRRRGLQLALSCLFFSFSAGSLAGTGEFCAIPNAQGTAVSYQCDVKYLPTTPNWLAGFKSWVTANKTTGAMACFGLGTYTLPSTLDTLTDINDDANRMVLRNEQNMKLCAPTGGAVFEYKTVNAGGTPLTSTVSYPAFLVSGSSGVSIKGMEFRNNTNYTAANNPLHHVTWTVMAVNSTDTRFFDSKAVALGKELVVAVDSSFSFNNTALSCAYYCLASYRWGAPGAVKPTITVNNSQFTIHHTKDPLDEHAALYTNNSDYFISNTSFNFITGQGFAAGVGSSVDAVNVSNVTITGTTAQGRPQMLGWIPLHPNLDNVHINYTGATPHSQFGRAYYCIGFTNPACESGFEKTDPKGSLFKHRVNATTAYTTAPFPPTRTKKLLFVNGSGQDAVWAQAVIGQNKPYLLWPLAQQWPSVGTALSGWLDAGDQVLTGDFLVPGQPRLLFFNTLTADGAVVVRALGGTANSGTMTNEAWINWTPAMAANLGGWHDANDKILAGDFTGLGRSQLLFMNVDGAGALFSWPL